MTKERLFLPPKEQEEDSRLDFCSDGECFGREWIDEKNGFKGNRVPNKIIVFGKDEKPTSDLAACVTERVQQAIKDLIKSGAGCVCGIFNKNGSMELYGGYDLSRMPEDIPFTFIINKRKVNVAKQT